MVIKFSNLEKPLLIWSPKELKIRKMIEKIIDRKEGLRVNDLMKLMGIQKSSINNYFKQIREKGFDYFGFFGYEYKIIKRKRKGKYYNFHIIEKIDKPNFDKQNNDIILYSIDYRINSKQPINYNNIFNIIINNIYKIFRNSKITFNMVVISNKDEYKKEISIDSELGYISIIMIYPQCDYDNWIDMGISGMWLKNKDALFPYFNLSRKFAVNITKFFYLIINKIISEIINIEKIKILDQYFV